MNCKICGEKLVYSRIQLIAFQTRLGNGIGNWCKKGSEEANELLAEVEYLKICDKCHVKDQSEVK